MRKRKKKSEIKQTTNFKMRKLKFYDNVITLECARVDKLLYYYFIRELNIFTLKFSTLYFVHGVQSSQPNSVCFKTFIRIVTAQTIVKI